MPRFLKLLLWLLAGTVLLCILAVILLSTVSLNFAAPWISQQLSRAINRPVDVQGALYLDWERVARYDDWRAHVPMPILRVHDIRVGNAQWATSDAALASAEFLRVHLDLFPLNDKVVRLAAVDMRNGYVTLERRADGANNWTFSDPEAPDNADAPSDWQVVIDGLMLTDATLRVIDPTREMDVQLAVSSAGSDSSPYENQWEASGEYFGVAVQGKGQMGGLLALQDDTREFPIEGLLSVGDTTLKAEGTITQPRQLAGIAMQLELSGPTMADLYPILGIALPNTPEYKTAGLLKGERGGDNNCWVYENFTGTVGGSDLQGTAIYEQRDPRPLLTADLTSNLLRFEDLGPLIGARTTDDDAADASADDDAASDNAADEAVAVDDSAEAQGETEGEAAGQITRAEAQPEDKALPVQEVDRNMWQIMDAEVNFEGKRIENDASLPLDDVRTHVVLEDGILKFDPLDFGVAGGTLETVLSLDGNEAPISASLQLQARGLQLSRLFPGVESMDAALGALHGNANLKSRGDSVAELLTHSSGQLSAVVSRGTVSQFLLEAAGLNVANMVFVKIFGDEQVVLQCLAAEFDITDGLVKTETFILETEDAVVTATGTVNMATEEMDIDVYPDNKSLRIFTLRSPLYVAGTFKNPEVGVQKGPVAARAGAAVVLGVVATPLAALLPLLNVGTDDETTCSVGGKQE